MMLIGFPDGRFGVIDDNYHLVLISPDGALTTVPGYEIRHELGNMAWALHGTTLFVCPNSIGPKRVMKISTPDAQLLEKLELPIGHIGLACVAAAATATRLFITLNEGGDCRVIVVNTEAGRMRIQTTFGGETGEGGLRWLHEPSGIAVHDDLVIIADCCGLSAKERREAGIAGTPSLHVCTSEGARLRTITGFFNPCDLVIAGGRLYVSNMWDRRAVWAAARAMGARAADRLASGVERPGVEDGEATPELREAWRVQARRVHALTLPALEPAPLVDEMLGVAQMRLVDDMLTGTDAARGRRPLSHSRFHSPGSLFVCGELLCSVNDGVFALQLPKSVESQEGL